MQGGLLAYDIYRDLRWRLHFGLPLIFSAGGKREVPQPDGEPFKSLSSTPPDNIGMSTPGRQPHPKASRHSAYVYRVIAREISTLTRYYDRLVQWRPRPDDSCLLFEFAAAKSKTFLEPGAEFPNIAAEQEERTAVLINGNLNYDYDIQATLMELKSRLSHSSRVVIVLYNSYLSFVYWLANRSGLRRAELPGTFITQVDLRGLAELTGFEIVRQRPSVYVPWRLWGLGDLANRILQVVPLLRWLSLAYVVTLRPIVPRRASGLTCVIPARNERGNIEDALKRFPDLGCPVEIVFVEGHSSDGTWEEIERVAPLYEGRFQIQMHRQTGKGKADAVRLGFSHATQPLLTILDADLTMPPELLGRFCKAYWEGHGDFINGSRLVYPMEGEAMRFLNRLGNVFFAKALSWVLDTRLSDSLCGTKLVARHDYQRMIAWRRDFGDFDPFGDFELLFPAAILGLGTIDIPVRYRARTYGSTNIDRFSHGLLLLRMTMTGLWRVKIGSGKTPDAPS